VNSRVFGICELKYAIGLFNGAKGVATTTKIRQKYAKTAHILVLYKTWRRFCKYDRVFGVANSNMLSEFFREQMALR